MRSEESLARTPEEGLSVRRAGLVILLSLLLHAPSLGWGFFADDYVHTLILDGKLAEGGMRPWALYEFGVLAEQQELRDEMGSFPYWTGDDWRAQFLRPLSSMARWAEHVAFSGSALAAHFVGLLWWALFLVLAWRVLLALGLAPRAALWALLLLAVHNGAAMPVGWCANRNTVVEGVFLLGAVLAFVRGASSGDRLRLWVAFACAALAVSSKESGVAAFALIAAWCWLGRGATRTPAFERGRARWAAAAIACAGAYVVLYVALGYGTRSAFYPTPWNEPLAWLERLALALPGSTVAAATPLATDVVNVIPASAPIIFVCGTLIFLVLRRALSPSARAHQAGPFLAAWILLTILPQAGAPLSDRLFLIPMVAIAGLLGIFIEATRLRIREGWARRFEKTVYRLLFVSPIALSALALVSLNVSMIRTAAFARGAIVEAEVGDASLGRRDVFVLQSPSQLVSLQPTATSYALTGDTQVFYRVLNATRRAVRWTRTGARSFHLESLGEPFLTAIFESVFLTDPGPIEVGHTWDAGSLQVRAVAVEDGRPSTIEVTLEQELSDPALRFLVWNPESSEAHPFGRWTHVPPPPIGESLTFDEPPAPIPFLP